jgi:hypothetical protein
MIKPVAEPVNPKDIVKLALAVVSADRFPFLAIIDGDQPWLRPVSQVKT